MSRSAHSGVLRPPSIGPRQWRHIYRLLGLVLLSDGRVLPEEMDAYINKSMKLARDVDPSLVVTRKMVLDWFILNKDSLLKDVESLLYDSIIIEILASLRPFKEKQAVILTMIEIGLAGQDYSARKQMFIRKTMLYWNISRAEEAYIIRYIKG